MAGQLEQKGKQMKVQNSPAREIPGNKAAGVGGREALKNGTKREKEGKSGTEREFLGIFAQNCTKMHENARECARMRESARRLDYRICSANKNCMTIREIERQRISSAKKKGGQPSGCPLFVREEKGG